MSVPLSCAIKLEDASRVAAALPLSLESAGPLNCDIGEAVYVGLDGLPEKPDASSLGLPPSLYQGQVPYSWDEPSDGQNVRLDLCLNYDSEGHDHLVLRRVVFRNALGTNKVLTVPDASVVRGLAEAVSGTLSPQFLIQVPFETVQFTPQGSAVPDESVLIIKALPQLNGVYLYLGSVAEPDLKPLTSRLLGGTLIFRDVIGLGKCPLDRVQSSFAFRIAPRSFNGIACVFSTTTGTRGYDIVALTIASDDGSTPFVADNRETVNQVLSVKTNHHNGCDSLVFAIGTTLIGTTSAAAFGNDCGEGLEHAPARELGDPNHVKYQVIEAGEIAASGFVGCPHLILQPSCT